MTNQDYKAKLEDFKNTLNTTYIHLLERNTDLKLEDYIDYNLSFLASNDISKKVNSIFINKFSEWKVGDKFARHYITFYHNKQETTSTVWKILEINIYVENEIPYFNYYCIDTSTENLLWYKQRFNHFRDLKDVDVRDKKGLRTKFWYERL